MLEEQQLRENVARSGHRPLEMEFATGFALRLRLLLWDRLRGYHGWLFGYLRECCFDDPGLVACPPFIVVPLAALHV